MRLFYIALQALTLLSFPAGAVTIAVPENLAPWGLNPDLAPNQRGIYANIVEAMETRSSVPIELRFVPYGRMMQELKSGVVDYTFAVVSPATIEMAPFSTIIAKVPMVAASRKGLTLKTLEDLHGFSEVGYLRGGSCGKQVDGDAAIHRTPQDSYDAAIRKMVAGRLDGVCFIKAGFTYAARMSGVQEQLGDQIDYGEVQIGFQVTRGKLDAPETKELGQLLEDLGRQGVTGSIFQQYVGAPYRP